eukprot:5741669-Prymnesium_polylepis.1
MAWSYVHTRQYAPELARPRLYARSSTPQQHARDREASRDQRDCASGVRRRRRRHACVVMVGLTEIAAATAKATARALL